MAQHHLPSCQFRSPLDLLDCQCEKIFRTIGGYVNAFLLFLVAIFLALAAEKRLTTPREIDSVWMITAAFLGGCLNYYQHWILKYGLQEEKERYKSILWVGVYIFILEMVTGIATSSLSLVSDAWHVLVDNGAILVSLIVASLVPARHDRNHVTHKLMEIHVLTDLFQSFAVVMAGGWIWIYGDFAVDAYVSFAIAGVLALWAIYIAYQSYKGKFALPHQH